MKYKKHFNLALCQEQCNQLTNGMKECGIELEQNGEVAPDAVKKLGEKLGCKIAPYMRSSIDDNSPVKNVEANKTKDTVALPVQQMTDKDGNSYDGQVKNNQQEGFGVMSYKNGNQYIGQWQAGQKSGLGQ